MLHMYCPLTASYYSYAKLKRVMTHFTEPYSGKHFVHMNILQETLSLVNGHFY